MKFTFLYLLLTCCYFRRCASSNETDIVANETTEASGDQETITTLLPEKNDTTGTDVEGSGDETDLFLSSEPPPIITSPPPQLPIFADNETKGEKGDPGPAGPIGPQGEKGENITGPPGESIKGEKGDSGATGPVGPQGLPGTCACKFNESSSGPISLLGADNLLQGAQNLVGTRGEKGDQGPKGSKGDRGVPGSRPDRGQKGLKGDRGPPGPPGHQVPRTSAGIQGPVGPAGEPGRPGPPGPSGEPGPSGLPGDGIKGEKGDPGEIRTSKDTGSQVIVGPPGKPGVPGPQGKPGVPGREGKRGRPGLPGRHGQPGLPGRPAMSNVVPGSTGPLDVQKGQKGEPGQQPALRPADRESAFQVVPGAVVFRTIGDIFHAFPNFQPGTLAYSLESETLLVRVSNGWREIQLGRFYRGSSGLPSELFTIDTHTSGPYRHLQYGSTTFPTPPRHDEISATDLLAPLPHVLPDKHPSTLDLKPTLDPFIFLTTIPTTTRLPDKEFHKEASKPEKQERKEFPVTRDDILHLIALNMPVNGNFNGLRGADFSCYHQARAAGFSTTFRAFISSSVQDLDKIVHKHSRRHPVVNLKGDILFKSWSSIFEDGGRFPDNVDILSFNGSNVLEEPRWSKKYVWHGTQSSGVRQENEYCHAWRSKSRDEFGLSSDLAQRQLLGQEKSNCDEPLVVLCVENMSKKYIHMKKWRQKRLLDQWAKSRSSSFDDDETGDLENEETLNRYARSIKSR